MKRAVREALAHLGDVSVDLGAVIDAGSARSTTRRARVQPPGGAPIDVVIKLTEGARDGFVRERAALSLVADHGLPGAVRLLGCCDDPPLVVLEDLGDGPSVADRLLGDQPECAERALVDWAVTVGRLQAASAGLGDEFRARLVDREGGGWVNSDHRAAPVAPDLLTDWLARTADALEGLLRPWGIQPSAAALGELTGLAERLELGAPSGLVPGDTCPDNALYVDGQLTLIDFEAAAHRHLAWEAAYLLVPWPTCWCSWALPDAVVDRTLTAWRATVAPTFPVVTDGAFVEDLARALIGWTFVSLTFVLPRARARARAEPEPRPSTPRSTRPRPAPRPLIAHRLHAAAGHSTAVLPALRDLAGEIHEACIRRWGPQELALAPAFRPVGSGEPLAAE